MEEFSLQQDRSFCCHMIAFWLFFHHLNLISIFLERWSSFLQVFCVAVLKVESYQASRKLEKCKEISSHFLVLLQDNLEFSSTNEDHFSGGGSTLVLHDAKRIRWFWFTVISGQTLIFPPPPLKRTVKDIELFWSGTHLSQIFAQNAPVLTCNLNEWNGIRFLTISRKKVWFWWDFFFSKK